MGPVANLPLGLLGVFDLKQNASYPRQVSDSVALSYDTSVLQEQNGSDVIEAAFLQNFTFGTYTAQAYDMTIFNGSAAVPAGYAFLLTHLSLICCQDDNAGGASAFAVAGYRPPGSAGPEGVVPLTLQATSRDYFGNMGGAANLEYTHLGTFCGRHVVRAGSTMSLATYGITGIVAALGYTFYQAHVRGTLIKI